MRVIHDAIDDPEVAGIIIGGSAGVGKSRIAREALHRAAADGTSFDFLGNNDIVKISGNGSDADAGASLTHPGDFDLAAIFGNGSTADAGASLTDPGNFDLSGVFGDMLHSTAATGGNFLVDILP